MFITTSFMGTKIGEMKYLFFLLTEDYIESHRRIKDDLEPLFIKFSRDIGNAGALIRPYSTDIDTTKNDILSKNWTSRERSSLANTPGILVISADFDRFDPRNDQWAHFSLRDTMDKQGNVFIFELEDFLSSLATCCNENRNIFSIVKSKAIRKALNDIYEVVELKPGVAGFSIDLIKGLELLNKLRKK